MTLRFTAPSYFWYRFHRFSTMRTSVRITLPVRLYHVYYVLTV